MQYFFIHINKTGGTSIAKSLGLPVQHVTAKEFIFGKGRAAYDKCFKFTAVRNPWDKVVSHYHYRKMTNQTNLQSCPIEFTKWVKLAYGERDPRYYDKPKMFMPQVDWLRDENGAVMVDHVIRFEEIEKGFEQLCLKLGVNASLPHLKKSSRGNFRKYYDEAAIEIVGNWFEQDVNMFGYRFE